MILAKLGRAMARNTSAAPPIVEPTRSALPTLIAFAAIRRSAEMDRVNCPWGIDVVSNIGGRKRFRSFHRNLPKPRHSFAA
jgi:hypothetical protein